MGTADQQVHRARAFLDAGARGVLVNGWTVPVKPLERLIDGFFAALNRDRAPWLALGEARISLVSDPMLGKEGTGPSIWGAPLLFTSP